MQLLCNRNHLCIPKDEGVRQGGGEEEVEEEGRGKEREIVREREREREKANPLALQARGLCSEQEVETYPAVTEQKKNALCIQSLLSVLHTDFPRWLPVHTGS